MSGPLVIGIAGTDTDIFVSVTGSQGVHEAGLAGVAVVWIR